MQDENEQKKLTHKLLRCPHCDDGTKPERSHRTACYRVTQSGIGLITFKCVACRNTFKVQGEKILIQGSYINVIRRTEEC
jgi:hypothetical protein